VLSQIYWFGEIAAVRHDPVKGVVYARHAAEEGSPIAMTMLGRAYGTGSGVARSATESARWYLAAADAGDNEAMYFLGEAYLRGDGQDVDVAEGLRWLRKAAEQWNPSAALELARAYDMGFWGVKRDPAEALRWYEVAAAGGIAEAIGWIEAHKARR
jgi:TPR repeat protein